MKPATHSSESLLVAVNEAGEWIILVDDQLNKLTQLRGTSHQDAGKGAGIRISINRSVGYEKFKANTVAFTVSDAACVVSRRSIAAAVAGYLEQDLTQLLNELNVLNCIELLKAGHHVERRARIRRGQRSIREEEE